MLGSGAAGMSAALVAATEGLSVVLLEKEDQIGGTTAWSGGMVWAPGSAVAKDAGFENDSGNAVQEYLISRGVAGNRLKTVPYGKERPIEICSDESCYSKNRRAVTVLGTGAGF